MDLRTRYEQEMALVRGSAAWTTLAALVLAGLLFPRFASGYYLYLANLAAVNVTVVVGLNLLVGFTGQISLGHAGFFAIGAYTTALLVERAGVPGVVALLAGALAAAAFGYLVGLPALRLSGPYLAIATLGFGIAVYQVLTNWEALSGGRMGLVVSRPSLAGLRLRTDDRLYYLVVGVAFLLTAAAHNLSRSFVGRALRAIRDSEIAAETAGVNLRRYKALAFAISAFYAGAGGGLMAFVMGYLEPQMFTLFESVYFLGMAVVGGLGAVNGSVLGGVLFTLLPQALAATREYVPVIYGAALVGIMAFEPLGLYGMWARLRRYFKSWPL